MADNDCRIIVELVSSADVARLEALHQDSLAKIQDLQRQIDGLHRTVYDLLEAFSSGRLKR